MDKRKSFERSLATARLYQKQASMVKESMGLIEPIADIPLPGGHFASHKLEQDYQMKHPFISTFHPGVYAGAAVGAALHGGIPGAVAGGVAGMAVEALHRYKYLTDATAKLEHGENPIDQRYDI